MLKRKVLSLLLLLAMISSIIGFSPQKSYAAAMIQSYPMPSIYTASSVFTLKADSTSIPVIDYEPEYDYAHFSFSGTVTMEVTVNEAITSYSISPLAKNITGTVDGNKLTFTLSTSTYVIVEINKLKKLVIAADPLETDIPASSGDGIYNVTDPRYNADSTGTTMATTAIQKAIDDANAAGGGIVYVPAGVYKCGNLVLKSDVTLYLAGGSVIVGTGNGADYTTHFHKSSISADGTYFITTEVNSRNITIRGRGTIDGKGFEMRTNTNFINNLLVPMQTTNFTFDGVILRDGGFWAFMPVRSDNVTITNYKGFQRFGKLEADAIDINECQNVLVKHSIAISEDDAFSTKTWPQKGMSADWPGAIENLDNVVFDDCLAWSRCVAFKMGQGICTPQTNVTVKNSYIYQCARGLLIDHGYTSNPLPVEGYAENITFENIDIERVDINQFGNYWFGVTTSTSGDVSNVLFKNINVRATGSQTSRLRGNPTRGGMIKGVTFTDVYVNGKLAKSLADLKAAAGENVSGVIIANSIPNLFSDDFEDGDYTGWTVEYGTWAVLADDSKPANTLKQGGGSGGLITAGDSSWTDYIYEVKMKTSGTNKNVGMVFRVTDANNYYMYRINMATSSSSRKMELLKFIDGNATIVDSTPFTTAVSNTWYTVKVVVRGNTIKGYVDGELMTQWTNTSLEPELTAGKIGLRTTSSNVFYDDVVVSPVNEAPTDIILSNNLVAENNTPGAIVGTFTSTDPDEGDVFTYTLVSGDGDTDNGSFTIPVLGNQLILREKPDYETKNSYSIRVRSTDSGGLSYEKNFIISVFDLDEEPTNPNPKVVLFSDDFQDGNYTGWTKVSSSGSCNVVAEDNNTNNKVLRTGSGTTLITLNNSSYTDFVYQAKVKVDINDANAGIVFRVKDTNNFYMYRLNSSNNKLELYKNVEGVMSLMSSTAFESDSSQWYTIAVMVQGNNIKGYANGELKLEWTNPETELTTGTIGFRTTSNKTLYDDILVTGINKAPTDIGLSNTSVSEDAASGSTVGTFSTTDPDEADTFTYTLVAGDGDTDNGSFTISGDTLQTVSEFVYDTKNTYSIRVRSTDAGGLYVEKPFTIIITKSEANKANASNNTVILDRNNVASGDAVTVIAIGDRQSAMGLITGDEKYIPTTWSSSEAGKYGDFIWDAAVGAYTSNYATSEAGTHTVTVTFQKQIWNGIEWVNGTTDTKTISLTVNAVSTGDNGDSGGGSSGDTYWPPVTDNHTGAEILINGKKEVIGKIATTQEGDKTVTTVSIDPSKLEQKLSQESKGVIVTIPVNSKSDVVVGELTGEMMKSMEDREAVLQIKTEDVIYTLPAAQINMDVISQQMGSQVALQDIKVNITIATPSADTLKVVQDTAKKNEYQIVIEPVEFTITCTSGSEIVEVAKFNTYVERAIKIPDGIDPSHITTGIVLNADGTFSHIPTTITVVDGKYYASIRSLTNSTYLAIYSPKTFADVATHWSKDAVNDMGSRLIIHGTGDGNFEPDRDITRAEFATIIVNGLGLLRPGVGKDIFADVTKDSWYYDAVAIAYEYGIIYGYGNGIFGPEDKITREQAMTMTARAMKITGLKVELKENEVEKLLSGFEDGEDSADYAKNSIASCIKTGIINGTDGNLVAPKNNITRAEAAVMVRRLLQKSGLI